MGRLLTAGLMVVAMGLAGTATAQAPAQAPTQAKVGATGLGLPMTCPQTLTMSSREAPPIFAPPQQLYIFDRVEIGGGKVRCIYINNNTAAQMPLEANAPSCQPLAPQNWSGAFEPQGTISCSSGALCTFRCN